MMTEGGKEKDRNSKESEKRDFDKSKMHSG